MSRANTDPVIVRSAAPDDRRPIERLLRDLPGVWQSSWRKDVVARALGASDDLAFVAVRDRGLRDRRLLSLESLRFPAGRLTRGCSGPRPLVMRASRIEVRLGNQFCGR